MSPNIYCSTFPVSRLDPVFGVAIGTTVFVNMTYINNVHLLQFVTFRLFYLPASFLLDVGNEVYVWEGWMPSEITKDKRGSAKRRWDEERKLTLQTALSYVEGR